MRSFSPGVVVNIAPWKSRLCIYLTLPDSFLTIDSYIPTHTINFTQNTPTRAILRENQFFFSEEPPLFCCLVPDKIASGGEILPCIHPMRFDQLLIPVK